MNQSKDNPKVGFQEHPLPVDLELLLGLGPEDASLVVTPDTRCLDLHPWLLDCVAVQVDCLGHQEDIPRAWDWENVLTLLEPGEELMYVLDHVRAEGNQTGRPFSLWLAIRFPRSQQLSSGELDRRRKRARMIVSQFQRQAFPGTELRWVDPVDLQKMLGFSAGSQQRCVCVSGMPSSREMDDDGREVERGSATRNYQSLNDVAESLVDLRCDYRLAFVVERVDSGTLKDRLGQAIQLRDANFQFIKESIQVGGSEGKNQNHQIGKTIANGFTKNENEMVGEQTNEQSGTNSQDGFGFILTSTSGTSESTSKGKSWSRTVGSSHSTQETETVGESDGISSEKNWSTSKERLRSIHELADRSLERTIIALHEAHGTGGYRWSAFIMADGRNADLIGGALVGVMAGAQTKDYPFIRFPILGVGADLFQGSESLLDLVAEAAPILPLPRACEALLLPEAELPGIRLRRNVFLGRTFCPPDNGNPRLGLGPASFSAQAGDENPDLIEIPLQDLFRHILVAGATGSGKTTRVVEILNNIKDDGLSIVVFETAKKTYRSRLQVHGRQAPLVYSLGSSREYPGTRFRPLRLNPFYFEPGTSLKRHVSVLSDALAELMPTEAMIGPLMRRAVETTYLERGWDIENGQPIDGGSPSWPTVLDFAAHVRAIAQTLTYGPEVAANYRGALENRAALFVDATFQDIFSHGGNKPIDELFPPGRDVIIEVEELPPSEVDIRAFVMTLLLSRLRSFQGKQRQPSPQPELAFTQTGISKESQTTDPGENRAEGMTTTVSDLLDEYVTKHQHLNREKKRLLECGAIHVSGRSVKKRDRVILATDIVDIAGEHVWPLEPAAQANATADCIESSTQAPSSSSTELALLSGKSDGFSPRRWLVVIEEAHNVLDRSFEVRRPADESNAGRTLLKCIDRLLQEGREMELGVMVVDQSPVNLARSVISNTGTKIVMRIEDGAEMEEIGRALGLEESDWKKLGFLQEGEAIIKASYMDAPVKTARFSNTSKGPTDLIPVGAGFAPSYTTIERLWRPVLIGAKAPDELWVKEVETACADKVDLAGFVGAKLLLDLRRSDSEVLEQTHDIRSVIASSNLSGNDLLCAAEVEYTAALVRGNKDGLLAMIRLMVRALLKPSSPDPGVRVGSPGIAGTSDLLEQAQLGTSAKWRSLFLALARGSGDVWRDACQRLYDYSFTVGKSDPSIPVRLLLERFATATSDQSILAAHSSPFDPVDLVMQVQELVDRACGLATQDLADAGLTERFQILVDHIVRQLTIDLASRLSAECVSSVKKILLMEGDHDA